MPGKWESDAKNCPPFACPPQAGTRQNRKRYATRSRLNLSRRRHPRITEFGLHARLRLSSLHEGGIAVDDRRSAPKNVVRITAILREKLTSPPCCVLANHASNMHRADCG